MLERRSRPSHGSQRFFQHAKEGFFVIPSGQVDGEFQILSNGTNQQPLWHRRFGTCTE